MFSSPATVQRGVSDSWQPSDECLCVLRQLGYSAATIEKYMASYVNLAKEFPQLIAGTDQDFAAHLQASDIANTVSVDRTLRTLEGWRLGSHERNTLVRAGYWPELIDNQVAEFCLGGHFDGTIVVSRFAMFRHYLSCRIPLPSGSIVHWQPSYVLQAFVCSECAVSNAQTEVLLAKIKQLFLDTYRDSVYFPQFYFSYFRQPTRL